jgi:S1-C subfamily serine protease
MDDVADPPGAYPPPPPPSGPHDQQSYFWGPPYFNYGPYPYSPVVAPPPVAQPWAWPLEQPAPKRSSRGAIVGAITALVAVLGSIVTVAIIAGRDHQVAARPPATPPAVVQPGATPLPSGAPTSNPSPVDQGIVDITTSLPGGEAAGTGMIITQSGEVLTNNHVIDGATKITMQIDGKGTVYTASVMGYDQTHDVALLKFDNPPSGLSPVTLGDSGTVQVGDHVVGRGNAYGRGGAPIAAAGSVIALDQTITATDSSGGKSETLNNLIEIDAQIVPGDSGGPLFNSDNKVVGMDTAGPAGNGFHTRGSGGAFAIPINDALDIVHQIEQGKGSNTIQIGTRGIMGVAVADSTSPAGSLIKTVEPGSPAEKAGIVPGDVITQVDGNSVDSSQSLGDALTGHHPGDSVHVTWVNAAGTQHDATMVLIPGPPA